MKARFLLLAFAGLPLSMGAQNDETAEPTYPIAEYDRAATIVMHEPNEELFVGTMHPAAALFMDYFNADKAAEEHEAYQDILRETGANVVTVRDLLLKGCVDEESAFNTNVYTCSTTPETLSSLTQVPTKRASTPDASSLSLSQAIKSNAATTPKKRFLKMTLNISRLV